MPDNLPKAFQSPLWPHLEEIRALRRARKMWVEIAQHLEQKHGIKMTYRAVRNFFVRATNPNRRIPAGLEEYVGAAPALPSPTPPPAKPAPHPTPSPPPKPAAPPEGPDAKAAMNALRASAQEPPPAEDSDWNFATDPTKPI